MIIIGSVFPLYFHEIKQRLSDSIYYRLCNKQVAGGLRCHNTRCFVAKQRGYPDSKVHGANMAPIWGQQDPGGPHVGLMNLAIWYRMSIEQPLDKLPN